MTKVELTHDWSANMWDWPMQHADGVVKVHNTKDLFEVGLEVQQYTPNEISVCYNTTHTQIHHCPGANVG
jgi:crystallin alpha B